MVTLMTGAGCAPLSRTQSANAVGVQFVSGGGGPECKAPQGVMYDPAQVCASQFHLDNESGIAASYGRRLWGVTRTDGINLRLGPEVVGAWISNRRLSAPLPTYPAEVSEWFAVGLLRLDVYNDGPAGRKRDQLLNRFSASVGGGLAFGRFHESAVLTDGTNNANRRADGVVGPVVNFGLGYWITRDVILRGDVYGTFIKPELSFRWNRYSSFAGIGLVKVF